MKNVLKILAIVFIALHVAVIVIFTGVLPSGFVQSFRLPALDRVKELFSENPKEPAVIEEPEEPESAPEEEPASEEKMDDTIRIRLSEPLPKLVEDDLYDLVHVLQQTGAVLAVSGSGENFSDRIRCNLTADTEDPGYFTAAFFVEREEGRTENGPVADIHVDLDTPYLALAETEVTLPVGADYDPASNVLFCMDLDGTVLTEFVESQGKLSTAEPGDYEIQFLIYSRVNASYTVRTTKIHIIDY